MAYFYTYPGGLYSMLFDALLLCAAALLAYYILTQVLLPGRPPSISSSPTSQASTSVHCLDHLPETTQQNSLTKRTIAASKGKSQSLSPARNTNAQNGRFTRRTSYFDTDDDQEQETTTRSKDRGGHRVGSISSTSVNWRNKAKFYQEEVQRVNMERGKLQDELTTGKMESEIQKAQLEADLASALSKVESLKREVIELKAQASDSISADGARERIDEQVRSYQELVAELESRLESKRDLERELNERISQLAKTNTQLMDRVKVYEEEKLEMERELLAAEEAERIAEENERSKGRKSSSGSVRTRLRRALVRICPCMSSVLNGTKRVGPTVTFNVDSPRPSVNY